MYTVLLRTDPMVRPAFSNVWKKILRENPTNTLEENKMVLYSTTKAKLDIIGINNRSETRLTFKTEQDCVWFVLKWG